MNKKVSTLLTLGLFVGGSLLNIVNAENLKDFVGNTPEKVDGSKYFIKVGDQFLHSTVDADLKKAEYKLVSSADDVTKENVSEYLWILEPQTQADNTVGYKFKNVKSGEYIRIAADAQSIIETTDSNAEAYKKALSVFFWNNATSSVNLSSGYTKAVNVEVANKETYLDDKTTANIFDVATTATNANSFELYKLADGIDVGAGDLNELYNSTGFNFNLNGDNLADVTNIFGDKKVVALKVDGSQRGAAGEKFPAGTYFATNAPVNDNERPTFAELLNCTFIAVNPVNNIADDADLQKKGVGFTLTEVQGRDLVVAFDDKGDNISTGNQTSVWNACFSVKENTTSDTYALSVKARFVKESGKNEQAEATVGISAGKGDSEISTVEKIENYIFKFAESTVIKPITLLNAEGAAIYNIQFYQKNGNDLSINGKYLTYDVDQEELIAKGEVLAGLNTPAYQWVISKVEENNNVVFTNRETGETLTTQLFKEGENLYSLAPEKDSKHTTFSYYNLDNKGNVNEYKDAYNRTDFNLKGKYIKLLPVKEVDNYAGYLNVEDKTVMTLSFGRDAAPTSNKLYPVVKFNEISESYNISGELTGDVESGAQWLLHKSVSPSTKKSNYVYANGELINTKTQGDVVYAYTYKLELVVDGKPQGQYLKAYQDIMPLGSMANLVSENQATTFFIEENKDGSVLLKDERNDKTALLLDDYKQIDWSINDFKWNIFLFKKFEVASQANYVKTYLVPEAPAVSLPGNEGHYTIATDLGNQITMNDERDGLTVKEETDPLYLYVTDQKAVVPSFYVTKAAKNKEERMFLFNPTDSVNYYVGEGQYDKKYQLTETPHYTKVIFKAASINETRDTLKTNIKGEMATVAMKANNTEKVVGGLDKFKVQIIESADADGYYNIRQNGEYVTVVNGKMAWGVKGNAQDFEITTAEAPTSNEGVAATEVKVVANNGSVVVKNAAGKNVVVSTILGQVVANEVLTSDNATINVPAGIVVVSVDGESFKVNVR